MHRVNLVVALPAEARPLAANYRLKRAQPDRGFPVYLSDAVALVVSGVGKTAAAAAVAHLHGLLEHPDNAVWINVGIAGHANRRIGEAVIAHRITDQTSGRRWFPPMAYERPCVSDNLVTHDVPQEHYPECALCDMEAAGFYPTAIRFGSGELIQCLKIVSDNTDQPASRINNAMVHQLIDGQLQALQQLQQQLTELAGSLARQPVPRSLLDRYTGRWRFTVSLEHQLNRLLSRWQTLALPGEPWPDPAVRLPNARSVIAWLQANIDRHLQG